MVESANYNRSVAAGALAPSITLGPVLPEDWNMLESLEGALNGHDNTNVMVWRLGPPDNGQVPSTCLTLLSLFLLSSPEPLNLSLS